MEHPCIACTDKTACTGSRNTLKKSGNPASLPEEGPCVPFNDYIKFLRNKKGATQPELVTMDAPGPLGDKDGTPLAKV